MQTVIAIAAGGGIGALIRHFLNLAVTHVAGTGFPWGIFLINVLGSALMGVLVSLFAHVGEVPQPVKAFLTVGILGGFTTFSTFSLDTMALIERGQLGLAALYAIGSVVVSVGALYGGMMLVRGLSA